MDEQCNVFNDPYDSAIMIDSGLKLQYPKEERKQAFADYQKQQELNRFSQKERSQIFVACFSESNTSFPMWGYYSAEHKGLCEGYKLREMVQKYNCFPVIYSDELIVYKENEQCNMYELSLTKSRECQHEREWRIVEFSSNDAGKNGRVLERFCTPNVIYIGCRRQERDRDNENLQQKEKDWDLWYADFSDIDHLANEKNIDLYLPLISRKEYKLIEKAIKL